jgi:ACS family pantothenate transporter-like MFS transporter
MEMSVGLFSGWTSIQFSPGLFIMDGVITIPIALLGYFIMPDLPSTTKPSTFYTQEHLHIAQKRMDSVGRKPPAKFTKKKVQYILTTVPVRSN